MASTDREALMALFRSTGGAGWKRRGNWGTNADLATWEGVQVNDEGRVVTLELTSNNLQGPIPSELVHLSALKELYLLHNQLSGLIPPELGELQALETLSLGYNKLSGEIPASLGQLVKLEALYLARNTLSGPIPPELGNLSALNILNLGEFIGGNNLTGPIPKELGSLSELRELKLSHNKLTDHTAQYQCDSCGTSASCGFSPS